MKNNLKIALSLFTLVSLISCSNSPSNISIKDIYSNQIKEDVFIVKVSEKQGASISFNINNSNLRNFGDNFSIKDNVSGTVAKKSTDIDHYLAYLIKNTSTTGYPSGGDPLGTMDLVSGPFTIPNSGKPTTKTIKFSNIPSLTTGAYYVVMRAQDVNNNDLIQDNNGSLTSWGSTTILTTKKIAVSESSGVTVDSNYIISTNTPVVNINLSNAIGVSIDASISTNKGNLDTVSVSLN